MNSDEASAELQGIPLAELPGSCTLHVRDGATRGVRLFDCPWERRYEALALLLGGYHDGQWRAPVRFPGRADLAAVEAELTGFGPIGAGGGGVYRSAGSIAPYSLGVPEPAYERCRLQVTYARPARDPDAEETVIASERIEFAAEVDTLPAGTFEWDSGTNTGDPVNKSVTVLRPMREYTYIRHRAATLDESAIAGRVGKVNSGSFRGNPAQTVLFMGSSARRTVTAAGERPYEIAYRFKYRAGGWNKLWSAADDDYESITPAPYETADFDALLED